MAQGSDPLTGFYSGGLSSVVSSGIGGLGGGASVTLINGGLSGGIGAKLAGGDFWEGVSQGLITAGLNHLTHTLNISNDPTWEYNDRFFESKEDLYFAILLDMAAQQFGIKDIAAFGLVLSGQPIIPVSGKPGNATPGTSPVSKYLSKKFPQKLPVRGLPTPIGTPKVFGGKGMKIAFTKTIGRFEGRLVPFVGWATLAYDVGATFYNSQIKYNEIIRQ